MSGAPSDHPSDDARQPPLPSATEIDPPPTFWGLTRGDAYVVLGLALIVLALAGGRFAWHAAWGRPLVRVETLTGEPVPFIVEINSATWIEFLQLDGIGETLARRIVADREANGPFPSVDDLTRVRGIGEKLLARYRPHLKCDPKTATAPSP